MVPEVPSLGLGDPGVLEGPGVSQGLGMPEQMGVHEAGRYFEVFVVIVESLSHVWLFVTPWTTVRQASLPFTISQSLL